MILHAVGISAGSGGGDAFDIAWAIDAQTGTPAPLTSFDFIRITTPTDVVLPLFFEKSTEVDAVADVAPSPFGDCDQDGDIDMLDEACLLQCFGQSVVPDSVCTLMDDDGNEIVDMADVAAFVPRITGPG